MGKCNLILKLPFNRRQQKSGSEGFSEGFLIRKRVDKLRKILNLQLFSNLIHNYSLKNLNVQ